MVRTPTTTPAALIGTPTSEATCSSRSSRPPVRFRNSGSSARFGTTTGMPVFRMRPVIPSPSRNSNCAAASFDRPFAATSRSTLSSPTR